MRRGINFGDCFEDVVDQTKPFVSPIEDWFIEKTVQAGFDHVRLPVKWDQFCDDENGFKINEEFAQAVEKTVSALLDNGLEVVLNVHHFRECMDAPRANSAKLFAMWEQISSRYAKYPDKLIFEVMNEPTWRTTAEEWNEVQSEVVALIRKTNPTRRIMICGIDYSGLFALDRLVPPKDDNLIATFHYYFPLEFTHQGASWSPTFRDLKDVKWNGTDEEVQDVIKGITEHAAAFGKKYNMPVNLGEFGAYNAADMDSRARWTKCVCETCENNGISWSYWELCRGFGCFTPEGEPRKELINALLR